MKLFWKFFYKFFYTKKLLMIVGRTNTPSNAQKRAVLSILRSRDFGVDVIADLIQGNKFTMSRMINSDLLTNEFDKISHLSDLSENEYLPNLLRIYNAMLHDKYDLYEYITDDFTSFRFWTHFSKLIIRLRLISKDASLSDPLKISHSISLFIVLEKLLNLYKKISPHTYSEIHKVLSDSNSTAFYHLSNIQHYYKKYVVKSPQLKGFDLLIELSQKVEIACEEVRVKNGDELLNRHVLFILQREKYIVARKYANLSMILEFNLLYQLKDDSIEQMEKMFLKTRNFHKTGYGLWSFGKNKSLNFDPKNVERVCSLLVELWRWANARSIKMGTVYDDAIMRLCKRLSSFGEITVDSRKRLFSKMLLVFEHENNKDFAKVFKGNFEAVHAALQNG